MKNMTASIQPWLSVENSATAEKFYKDAFSAIETYRMETPDGGLVVRLSVNGSEFWVSGQFKDSDETPSKNLKQDVVRLILIVENPDEIFQQAIKAGATEVFAVGEEHGWRLGRLSDPFGLDWEIGKLLTEK